ncbi:MAG: ribonuclease HII [Chitinispirillaceae bacterium]
MSERSARKKVVSALYKHDRSLGDYTVRIAGVDEAGRGPLAGPVVAGAVCLDLSNPISGIDDSKKLSAAKRDELFQKIVASGCRYAVGIAEPKEVDDVNILQATFCAMRRALEKLEGEYDRLLVDGNLFIRGISRDIQKTVVGGDALSASIAAASIIAKVTRDRLMEEYHLEYPQYGFLSNKGYGTEYHREMIEKHGLCPIHRRSFCHAVQMTLSL